MADSTIDGLPTIATVDRATDKLPIWDTSDSLTGEATINSMLGFSGGNPVSTSDSQTLTNKTLTSPVINTPTLAVNDNAFTIRDNADTTKVVDFQLSGITTGTTRTLTIPNASTTIVGTDATQTLTNKTITAPTITNPTLTIDAISEFTGANGVTIDGLNIKDSALNTNNSVPNNAWNNTGAFGSSWAYSTWGIIFTGLSGGTLNLARYTQQGKRVDYIWQYTLTGANVSGSITFTLPVTARSLTTNTAFVGTARYDDIGTQTYGGKAYLNTSSTVAVLFVNNNSGTYETPSVLSSTVPHTWASTDIITVTGTYEAS